MIKIHKTIRYIIATLLAMAIALTGITFSDTVTAKADTEPPFFKNGMTVTMKPGETKQFIFTVNGGMDFVDQCKWTSSDTSVVKANTNITDDTEYCQGCIEITAVAPGTATVTGTRKSSGALMTTVTIKVGLSGPTANQKACKHSWKTTTKATCQRSGIKTCKRCKYQKTIPVKDHKYETQEITNYAPEYGRIERTCGGCDKMFISDKIPVTPGETKEEHDRKYWAAYEKMEQEYNEHVRETHHVGWEEGDYGYGKQIIKTKETLCVWCHKRKGE